MNLFLQVVAASALIVGLAGCQSGQSDQTAGGDAVLHLATSGSVAQTINGIEVPEALLVAIATGRGLDLQQPAQRQQVLAEATQYVLLAEQAEKLKLEQQADLAALIEAARLRGVANAAVIAYKRSHPVTDAMVAADYQQQLKEAGDKTYRFTQLLFADEATAEQAAAELAKGTPFSKVFDSYRDKAQDARSYPNVFPRQLPVEMAAALVALKPGEASTAPVHSSLGWHLLYLDGVNPFQPPPLAQVEDQVRKNLEQKQAQAYVDTLKKDAVITMVNPANTSTAPRPESMPEPRKARAPNVVRETAPAPSSTAPR